MKLCFKKIKAPFLKGVLCGAIIVILLFVSWRLVLLAAGLAVLYFLICKC